MDQELIAYLDRRAAEVAVRSDQRDRRIDHLRQEFRESHRPTQVVVEGLRSDVQAVAEGVPAVDRKLERRIEAIDRRLDAREDGPGGAL